MATGSAMPADHHVAAAAIVPEGPAPQAAPPPGFVGQPGPDLEDIRRDVDEHGAGRERTLEQRALGLEAPPAGTGLLSGRSLEAVGCRQGVAMGSTPAALLGEAK